MKCENAIVLKNGNHVNPFVHAYSCLPGLANRQLWFHSRGALTVAKKPWITTLAGLLAAALLLAGGLTVGWWTHSEGALGTHVGLREAEMCRNGACASVLLDRIASTQDLNWLRAGTGAYVAAWMASMLCLSLAGAAAAGKRWPLLARTTLVAGISAIVVGVLFVLWAPASVPSQPGLAMPLYFAGALVSIATAILGLRRA